jgi:hypothetical protein
MKHMKLKCFGVWDVSAELIVQAKATLSDWISDSVALEAQEI